MSHIEFEAPEYQAGGAFAAAAYAYDQARDGSWTVRRNGQPWLALGAGYRAMRVLACGVCSTDLAREHLPFPLPQITGHEALVSDERGRRFAVEINASHAARGLHASCAFCAAGLSTHCPERLVLGIHDLPGGFAPWILAPVNALVPVSPAIDVATAVLIEPLAAALHAVRTIDPKDGDTIAVLGPRRLGMLVIAALHAFRTEAGRAFTIVALSRNDRLLPLAGVLGADRALRVVGDGNNLDDGLADVVIDTTGQPEGLLLAIRLARREVHLKSTHGRPAAGLRHLTELVVDELVLRPATEADGSGEGPALAGPVAWLASAEPPADLAARVVRGRGTALLAGVVRAAGAALPRADVAVVEDAEELADAIRPGDVASHAVVRPRGAIAVLPGARGDASPLLRAVVGRGLRLTSSRCGDLRAAAALLERDPDLRRIGERLVTHWFGPDRMNEAFATARSAGCIKAVVSQPEAA